MRPSARQVEIRAESDGTFQLVARRAADTGPDVQHTLIVWVEPAGQERTVRAARVDWLGDLADEIEHDLGALTLVLPPLLAEGRAVDSGAGVPALVQVDRPWRDEAGEVCWSRVPSFETRAAPDGSFQVRGFLPEDVQELRLRASHTLGPDSEVVVPAGAGGIVLSSLARAELWGSAWLEPELEPYVSIAAHGPALFELPLRSPIPVDEPPELGGLVFGGRSFPPGSYALRLSVAGEPQPGIELGRVVLSAGEPARVPGLDLRGFVRPLRLTLRDEQGAPVPDARIQRRRPGARAFESHGGARELEPGLWELATTEPELELLVTAPRLKQAHLARVLGDRTVVLQRMLDVEVTLANMPPVAGSALDLHLALEEPLPGTLGVHATGSVDRGWARLALTAPGRYTLSVTLRDPAPCGRRAWKGTWIRLDVRDVEGLQRLEAQLSERDVEVLLERWKAAEPRR
ncbi:MAG TPA: hypothetical protein VF530_06785 [Planctomycetota bacterium]